MAFPAERWAVILAAGASTRMGMPKACARLSNGDTFLERLHSTYRTLGWRVAVVVGANRDVVIARHPSLTFVPNEAWEEGQWSSVLEGLRFATANGVVALAVHPVDAPLVTSDTVRVLLAALSPEACVIPRHEGRSGHPVLLDASGAAALIAGNDDNAQATFEQRLAPLHPRFVDVTDRAVTDNFNRASDIRGTP